MKQLNILPIGHQSGDLVVISSAIRLKGFFNYPCLCSCGRLVFKQSTFLTLKKTRVCQRCSNEKTAARNKANATHGMVMTRIYREWGAMKSRVKDKNKNYLWLGITVCQEWKDSFEAFRDWAFANGYDDTLTLDRRDTLGNYEPANCRWVSQTEQQYNKLHNLKLPNGTNARQVARANGITDSAFDRRLSKGWSLEKACTYPMRKNVDGKYLTC